MKVPLVILNMLHQRVRTLVGIAGVAFAILLIFMQLGFYGSAETAATSLYQALDFDIVLIPTEYLNVNRSRTFPRTRLLQALGHPDVAAVTPLYLNWQTWHIPETEKDRRAIFVVGFDLDASFFKTDKFHDPPAPESLMHLRTPDTVLVDTDTRKYFGPCKPGLERELGYTRVEIVGRSTIGTGYGADGMVLTSQRTYGRVYGSDALDHVALGLIRLKEEARPRAREVKESLARNLYNAQPRDEVRPLTRAEIEQREQRYWMERTSVGVIFRMGVFVAFIVGAIFVYQVIATDIANHFAEYATLKAIGYGNQYLSGVVLRQAILLSLLGYVPGLLVALALYTLGRVEAEIPLAMTWGRAAFVLLLSVAMCSLSGFLALRKVKSADPAELF